MKKHLLWNEKFKVREHETNIVSPSEAARSLPRSEIMMDNFVLNFFKEKSYASTTLF